MKRTQRIIVIVMFLIAAAFLHDVAAGEKNAYNYEPHKVELTGILIRKIFYGPPGYGEDPKTDKKEYAYIIKLEKPISAIAAEDDTTNESHDNVKEIQVVNIKHISLKPLLQKRVTAKGTLFSAITGHHHTDVLINLEEISNGK